jgi:hypothetical protein
MSFENNSLNTWTTAQKTKMLRLVGFAPCTRKGADGIVPIENVWEAQQTVRVSFIDGRMSVMVFDLGQAGRRDPIHESDIDLRLIDWHIIAEILTLLVDAELQS